MTAFAGEWWLKDNYVAQEYQPEAIAVVHIMAVLILCVLGFTYILRTSGLDDAKLANVDKFTAVVWLVCGANTHMYKHLYKPDKYMANMALQVGLAAAYFWQSTTRGSTKKD